MSKRKAAFGPGDWLLSAAFLAGCVLVGFTGGLLLIGLVAR